VDDRHCRICENELPPGRVLTCDADCEAAMIELQRLPQDDEHCRVCGEPLPAGRSVSCDADCYAVFVARRRAERRSIGAVKGHVRDRGCRGRLR
jgi:predicted nucleic acid-binding Zn ribbon protein